MKSSLLQSQVRSYSRQVDIESSKSAGTISPTEQPENTASTSGSSSQAVDVHSTNKSSKSKFFEPFEIIIPSVDREPSASDTKSRSCKPSLMKTLGAAFLLLGGAGLGSGLGLGLTSRNKSSSLTGIIPSPDSLYLMPPSPSFFKDYEIGSESKWNDPWFDSAEKQEIAKEWTDKVVTFGTDISNELKTNTTIIIQRLAANLFLDIDTANGTVSNVNLLKSSLKSIQNGNSVKLFINNKNATMLKIESSLVFKENPNNRVTLNNLASIIQDGKHTNSAHAKINEAVALAPIEALVRNNPELTESLISLIVFGNNEIEDAPINWNNQDLENDRFISYYLDEHVGIRDQIMDIAERMYSDEKEVSNFTFLPNHQSLKGNSFTDGMSLISKLGYRFAVDGMGCYAADLIKKLTALYQRNTTGINMWPYSELSTIIMNSINYKGNSTFLELKNEHTNMTIDDFMNNFDPQKCSYPL